MFPKFKMNLFDTEFVACWKHKGQTKCQRGFRTQDAACQRLKFIEDHKLGQSSFLALTHRMTPSFILSTRLWMDQCKQNKIEVSYNPIPDED